MKRLVMLLSLGLASTATAGLADLSADGEAAEGRLDACAKGSCDPAVLPEDLFTVVVYRWVTLGAVDRQAVADLQFVDADRFAQLPRHLQSPASRPSAWLAVQPTLEAPPAPPEPPVPAEVPVAAESGVPAALGEAPPAPKADERPAPARVPTTPQLDGPVFIEPGSDQLTVTHRVGPEIPSVIFDFGQSTCKVLVTVGTDGVPTGVEPSQCGAFDFANTKRAVEQWRFEPLVVDREVRPFQTELTVRFTSPTAPAKTTEQFRQLVARYGFIEPNGRTCAIAADLFEDDHKATIGTMGTSDLTQCFAAPARPSTSWPAVEERTDCTLSVTTNRAYQGKVAAFDDCPESVQKAAKQLVRSWKWAEPTYGNMTYELRLRFHPDAEG